MNFTWFASAYDDDDVAYRIAVLVQMTGVLILAAGVSRALGGGDFAVILVGYLVMRLSMVTLWLQAAASDRDRRQCTLRYAVALWPEAVGRTSWHPDHIAERYGLFTIIVLDETLLAPTVGVEEALNGRTTFGHLALVAVGGLLIVFSMCCSPSTCLRDGWSNRSVRPSPNASVALHLGLRPLPGLRRGRRRGRAHRGRRSGHPPVPTERPSSPASPSPSPSPLIWWSSGPSTFPTKSRASGVQPPSPSPPA